MKRTCNGCKAYGDNIIMRGFWCSLGYKQIDHAPLSSRITMVSPVEDCPKPMTLKQLDNAPEKVTNK